MVIAVARFEIHKRVDCVGEFELPGGARIPLGPVRIVQLSSGQNWLHVKKSVAVTLILAAGQQVDFIGQTRRGLPVRTTVQLDRWINSPQEYLFHVERVQIGVLPEAFHRHEFVIANALMPNSSSPAVRIDACWRGMSVPVTLRPRRDYKSRFQHLSLHRGVLPTATLTFGVKNLPPSESGQFASDLCLALSVIQGSKTNWISHDVCGPRKSLLYSDFLGAIVKPYCPGWLCFDPVSRRAAEVPISAVAEVLPRIIDFRESFDPDDRVINAWLDAKTETDYLEGRTLKYVVVVEALNALTMRVRKDIVRPKCSKEDWRDAYEEVVKVSPLVSQVLTLSGWMDRIGPSFLDQIKAIFEAHGVAMGQDSLKGFRGVRNAIVHRLDYAHSCQLPKSWGRIPKRHIAQHFFVADFVDRVILQIFGLRQHLS